MEDRPGTGAAGPPPDGREGAEPEIVPPHVLAPVAPTDRLDQPSEPDESTERPTARTTGEPSPLIARRARAGDNTSFARLIEHYDPHLRAFASGMVGEPERVDGILDDAYIKAYRAIPRLARDASADGWLCRAAYLACVDDLRRTRRRSDGRAEPAGGGTAMGAGRSSIGATSTDPRTSESVQRTVLTLPVEERTALLLVDAEGFGHRTVAEALDVEPSTVPPLLSRARAALLTVVDDDPLVALNHGDAIRTAVRSLPVPEHDAEFWNRLGGRLLHERERPAVSTLDPEKRLAARPPQDGTIPVEWTQGSVSELARQADLVRDAPDRGRRWLIAAVAAVVMVVVGFALWIGFSAAPDTRDTTAADVATLLTDNLATAPYIVGQLRISGTTPSGTSEVYELTHAATGSFHLRGDTGTAALDVSGGTSRELLPARGQPPGLLELTGLATGPPDPVGDNRYRFEDDFALVARVLINAGDEPVRAAERSGREVWLLSQPVVTTDDGVDRIDVSVDRETSLPVEVARYRRGEIVERRQFSGLRVSSTVPAGSFTIDPPAGARVGSVDRGFRRTSLPEVGAAVGYDPVTPSWLPEGFELRTVAYLRGTRPSATPAGAQNPPDTDVISLAYRRGIQQITLTTRRDGGPTVEWTDPFGTAADDATAIELKAGRFHGTTVEEVAGEGIAPAHLWGQADGLVFTLAGDVAAADLRRMAGSLR